MGPDSGLEPQAGLRLGIVPKRVQAHHAGASHDNL